VEGGAAGRQQLLDRRAVEVGHPDVRSVKTNAVGTSRRLLQSSICVLGSKDCIWTLLLRSNYRLPSEPLMNLK
jgi:hypothetical protein